MVGYIFYFAPLRVKMINLNLKEDIDAANREYFVYSESEIFKTIMGIRLKNCRLSESSQADLNCQEMQMCNIARRAPPYLSRTCAQRYPRSIIIGVAKGGTRELIDFLAMHPAVVIKRFPTYELCFFRHKWTHGLEWYRKRMPLSMPNQITIEKCPFYFSDPNSPSRIRKMDPHIKLILIVRDPVDRTISHMTFKRNKSAEYITNVANNRISDDTRRFRLSFYDEPFERYLKYYNRSQIHIVDSERFKTEPYSVLRETETFLGLPHLIRKEDVVFNTEKGFYCLKKVNSVVSTCYDETRGREEVKTRLGRVRSMLKDLFKPHNERFFNLTGRRFTWL